MDRDRALPFNENWHTAEGFHDGGVSCGIGYTIAWQRGPAPDGCHRNGAFLEEVLTACLSELNVHQAGPFPCVENAEAVKALENAIDWMASRRRKREAAGVLGINQA